MEQDKLFLVRRIVVRTIEVRAPDDETAVGIAFDTPDWNIDEVSLEVMEVERSVRDDEGGGNEGDHLEDAEDTEPEWGDSWR